MSAPRCGQAVILAAGRGERMRALTQDHPKCLCPLAGRSILSWTLAALRANGIESVLIVGGWRHELLAGSESELRVNHDWASGNMVRSLLTAADWCARADTLIVYGDGAYGSRAIGSALQEPHRGIAVPVDRLWLDLWRRRFADPLDDAESLVRDNDGRLLGIGQRRPKIGDIHGQFMGLLRMTPEGWQRVADALDQIERDEGAGAIDKLDTTAMLSRLIMSGVPVHCVDVDGGWVEIDSPHDVASVEAALADPCFAHDFRR